MLKWLRKYSRSWFIALIIGAIAVVFILWGVGGLKSPRLQEVASVNGAPILMTAYIRQYNDLVRQYQEFAKGELTEENLKAMRLKEQALNRLIDETLLLQGGERLGIRVSNAELQEQIRNYPFFQEGGQFNERRYQQVLARNRLNPADFEAQERQRLLMQKIIRAITSFAKVSDAELREFFQMARETVEVRYLVVSPERFLAAQRPSDPEIEKYYQEHQEQFRTPERAKVRYLLFRAQDFQEKARPTPAEVADYIKDHGEEFTRSQVIQVRQLLLTVPPKATAAERRRIENEAQALLRQVRMGADFAALAQKFSQDERSRDKGGDLGAVKRGQYPPEWDKAAFSLKKGEVGLARTPKGFHLLKLEEVKEYDRLPEAEARTLASQRLLAEKSRRLAQDGANRARGELNTASMAEVGKKYGVPVKETPLLTMVGPVPELGAQPTFNQAALALKPKETSKVVDLLPGFAILQGVEHEDAHIPPLEKCKDQVRQAVSRQMAKKQAAQDAAKIMERLRKGEPLAKVAAQAGLPLQDSGPFTRFQGFLQQPQAEALTSAAFKLSGKDPYPPHPLVFQDKYYLLAFKARKAPSPEEFQKERDKLQTESLEHKRSVIFNAWLADARQQAKIKIYEIP
ncbi:MAG: SurA N-terminal domain-containing protein [Deltaproteobacteria bacterium]|nr:SurA N-terminal domain-containing protein [Deltaproteobacteria bacterium]